jgi:hypothetical protein
MLSYVENYWLTSIISHNILPFFRSSFASCFSTIGKCVHHSNIFCTFYKKLIAILQKYNMVISHVVVTLIKHNIYEGKTTQINNLYIIYFTICSNGNLKNSNMSISIKIFHILMIVKWLTIRPI